ncbi:uncharacterized protein LOC120151189 [Hibiscus syriacus]|uniref:uncharacterized protein LOC120151189 n=1 Tax=Hibiscus syriacus TaxID=106335 RepID=UPI001924B939|nr:uncharacterized protein LOC120151189 [Hibiscus syriacus]
MPSYLAPKRLAELAEELAVNSFKNFFTQHNLMDLGFKGPQFTWMRGGVFEQPDKMVANDCWNMIAPVVTVYHLPRIKSDHRHMLLRSSGNPTHVLSRRFRFFAGWTKQPQFNYFVQDNWNFKGNIQQAINNFTESLKIWNKNVVGHIIQDKKNLKNKISAIQATMDKYGSDHLQAVQMDL